MSAPAPSKADAAPIERWRYLGRRKLANGKIGHLYTTGVGTTDGAAVEMLYLKPLTRSPVVGGWYRVPVERDDKGSASVYTQRVTFERDDIDEQLALADELVGAKPPRCAPSGTRPRTSTARSNAARSANCAGIICTRRLTCAPDY